MSSETEPLVWRQSMLQQVEEVGKDRPGSRVVRVPEKACIHRRRIDRVDTADDGNSLEGVPCSSKSVKLPARLQGDVPGGGIESDAARHPSQPGSQLTERVSVDVWRGEYRFREARCTVRKSACNSLESPGQWSVAHAVSDHMNRRRARPFENIGKKCRQVRNCPLRVRLIDSILPEILLGRPAVQDRCAVECEVVS